MVPARPTGIRALRGNQLTYSQASGSTFGTIPR